MGFSDSSALLKISLVVLPMALILHIVGLATPHWSSFSGSVSGISASESFGLWSTCLAANGQMADWINACRGFGIIGVLAVAAAAILEVLCTVVLSKATHKVAFLLATLAAFVGAATIILCAIIWAAKTSDLGALLGLSWSFGLSIAGGVLAGIGGMLVAIDLCQNSA